MIIARSGMRRIFHLVLAAWLAIAVGLAQSCTPPSQNAEPYSPARSSSSQVGRTGRATFSGNTSGSAAASLPPDSGGTHIDTSGYRLDEAESKALTAYLTQHKLPLVGAQVLDGSGGQRAVVLYGFVGSDFGHSDAVTKARRYLGDQSIAVDNRVKVRPELLSSNSSPAASPDNGEGAPDESNPGVQDYLNAQNNAQAQNNAIQQYQNQGSGSGMTSVIPLVMMLAILSMGMSGGNFSVGPGSSGSPFGYTPSNPYPGYPPPYSGSPYGSSPYGSSPFGSSPFGSSPFGSSPFGP
jgi:hypothetical protein